MKKLLFLMLAPLLLLTLTACDLGEDAEPVVTTEIVEARVVTLTTPTELTVETTDLFNKKIYKVTDILTGVSVKLKDKVHVELISIDGVVTQVKIIGVIE